MSSTRIVKRRIPRNGPEKKRHTTMGMGGGIQTTDRSWGASNPTCARAMLGSREEGALFPSCLCFWLALAFPFAFALSCYPSNREHPAQKVAIDMHLPCFLLLSSVMHVILPAVRDRPYFMCLLPSVSLLFLPTIEKCLLHNCNNIEICISFVYLSFCSVVCCLPSSVLFACICLTLESCHAASHLNIHRPE